MPVLFRTPQFALNVACGLPTAIGKQHGFAAMQQHVGYRSVADPARRQPGKFMASWTGCVGRRLRQGFSTATGSVACSPGTSRPADRVGCRNRRLTRQANQRDNVIIRRTKRLGQVVPGP